MNWWNLAAEALGSECPDWDLLLQVFAFHAAKDLAMQPNTREQLQRLSGAFGLDPESVEAEFVDLCPIASQFANHAPTASDCSARS